LSVKIPSVEHVQDVQDVQDVQQDVRNEVGVLDGRIFFFVCTNETLNTGTDQFEFQKRKSKGKDI
jgi:hypothetical protein